MHQFHIDLEDYHIDLEDCVIHSSDFRVKYPYLGKESILCFMIY